MPSSQSQFHEPGTNAFAQNPTTQNSWGEMPFVAILKSLILQSLNLCFVNEVTGIMESVVKEVGMRLLRILAHMVSPNPTSCPPHPGVEHVAASQGIRSFGGRLLIVD